MEEFLNEFPATDTTIPSFTQGLEILLVDEDVLSLVYISSMLEEFSFKVTSVEQVSVALSMIRKQKNIFRLVITNVNMPDIDNLSFLREIINNEIPIIVMSSNSCVAERAIAEGACKFIQKPVALNDLKNVWQHADWKRKDRNKEIDQVNVEEKRHNRKGSQGFEINESRTLSSSPPMEGDIIIKASVTLRPPSTCIMIKETRNSILPSTDVLRKLESGFFSIPDVGCEFHGNLMSYPMSRRMEKEGKITSIIDDENNDMQNTGTRSKQGSKLKRQLGEKEEAKEKKKSKTNLKIINSGSLTIDGRGKIKDGGNNNTFNEQKSRIIWTPELHLKFAEAVSALGDEIANPKMIEQTMNEPRITRSQISSHLQKYKSDIKRLNETGTRSSTSISQPSFPHCITAFAPLAFQRRKPPTSDHVQGNLNFRVPAASPSVIPKPLTQPEGYGAREQRINETGTESLPFASQSSYTNARTSFSFPVERPSSQLFQQGHGSFSFGVAGNTLSDAPYVSTSAQVSQTSLPSSGYTPPSASSYLSAAMLELQKSPTLSSQNPDLGADLAFANDGTTVINEVLNSEPLTTTQSNLATNQQEVWTNITHGSQNLTSTMKHAPSRSEYEDILRILDAESLYFNNYANEANLDQKGYEWLKKNLNGKNPDPF